MDFSWLFLTVALTGLPQQAPPPVSILPTAPIRATFEPAADARPQQQGERAQPQNDRPHMVGVGSAITGGSQGIGGATRFFFNERIGIDFNVSWYHPQVRNATGSIFQVTPSFQYMLKPMNELASVDIRPYVGGGLNYVYSSYRPTYVVNYQATGGLGGQAYGGAEITFEGAKWVTISVEGRYYALPVNTVNVSMVDGMNFLMMLHFYLR
jgi:hypothetical protein